MQQPADIFPLLQRYQAGQCTPDEVRAVEAWYEALGQDQPRTLPADEAAALQARLWQQIAARTVGAKPAVVRPLWRQWAAAAAVVVGGALGAWWYQGHQLPAPADVAAIRQPEWVDQTNESAQPTRVALADGSVVTLQPASTLRYPRHFRGAGRQVFLTGEAFFDVAHNPARPFRVLTDKVVTTVLGTSFTVRAFPGQARAEVQVRTGRVRVSPRWNPATMTGDSAAVLPPSVVVLPNQEAVYAPAEQQLTTALVAAPVELSQQPLVFDDRPATEVLATLAKAYGVEIVYDRAVLANCSVTLVLRDPTLFGKLDIVCKTLGATYEKSGTRIIVHATGCAKD